MKVGDTAYIVESNRYVREVEIRRCYFFVRKVKKSETRTPWNSRRWFLANMCTLVLVLQSVELMRIRDRSMH